jgi:hypothetical protein
MYNIPTVTLQTAVLLTIKEFADAGNKFSAHDITRSIRDKCNVGKLEIPEVEDLSGADSFRYNVQHNEVRDLFNEMRDNGVFDADYTIKRNFNGMFFEYTASSTAPISTAYPQPTVQTQPTVPVAPMATAFSAVDAEIKRRVTQYLQNCKTRNFRPNLKQVQSAIKRGSKSTGISSEDLLDLITKDMGFSVTNGSDTKHTQVIV